MHSTNRTLIGAIIVLIGLLFLSDTMGVAPIFGLHAGQLIAMFWPLILIALGLRLFFQNRSRGSVILMGLGIIFLISTVFNVDAFSLFWPLIIIFIGVSMLIEWPFKGGQHPDLQTVQNAKIDQTTIFWGSKQKVASQSFEGGEVNAIFGGVELDLREAKLSHPGATLDINAIFGGIEIHVSKDAYRIESHGDGIAGGWENKFENTATQDLPLLTIKGAAIFGGVEVKN